MNELELQQRRREKWRLAGTPVRTLDDARAFFESVGMATMYPLRPPVLAPTFFGAWVGADDRLPTWQHAFSDARNSDAKDLMVRCLRERICYEANVFGETNFLVSAALFPYFYALAGDRNPRQAPSARGDGFSPLARDAFELIRQEGPISKERLRVALGRELSEAALDRALNEMWSRLRITRVDYLPGEGVYWDLLYKWAPDAVREGMHLSVPEALSALVSKYLDAVIAADMSEIEEFFGHIVARSRVREATNALLAARELSMIQIGRKPMLQITPPKTVPAPIDRQRRQPIVRRPKRHL